MYLSQTLRRGAVAGAALALVAPVALAAPASASTTSNEVVYAVDANNDGFYSVEVRNLDTRVVSVVLPADPTGATIYDDPELSPDGSLVALSSDRGAADFDEGIVVVGRDGSNFRRLTSPVSTETSFVIDISPSWSPDGRTLLFTRITTDATDPDNPTSSTALWTVPAAGGTASVVPNTAGGYTADWSPDGTRIVYAELPNADADSGPLTVANRDGSGKVVLGPSGLMPAWSPDGQTIAYATVTARDSDRNRAFDTAQIATVPARGGAETRLAKSQPTTAATVAEWPQWMPDGQSILFNLFGYSSTTFPPADIWAIDRDGLRAGRFIAGPGDEAQPHAQGPAPSPVSPGTASTYTSATPKRVLDTRNGTGARTGRVGPGGTIELPIRGISTAQGTVPANASAVVLNLTVANTTAATDVRVYPSGTGVPQASNLNARANQVVPNLVTARIGDNGAITIRNAAGEAHFIADIAGWYTPDTAGAGYAPLDPRRVLDTRNGTGGRTGRVGPGGTFDLQVAGGSLEVPADASAVVLNVTGASPTASTDLRVYPTPSDNSIPTVSNLNLVAGQVAANLVTVAVGEGGKVRFRNAAGEVHFIADLAGYYSASAPGRFVPVAPLRFLDTRVGVGAAPIATGPAGELDLAAAGFRGVPAGASAVVLNLTGTSVTAGTDVRAYPAGVAMPTVSNLNLTPGVTRANQVIVKTGANGRVTVRNSGGDIHLISDISGYFVG